MEAGWLFCCWQSEKRQSSIRMDIFTSFVPVSIGLCFIGEIYSWIIKIECLTEDKNSTLTFFLYTLKSVIILSSQWYCFEIKWQIKNLILLIMTLQGFSKTKASTLAKIAALPRYRHPMDLLNEPTLPFQLQRQQIQGQLPFEGGQYLSQLHFKLSKQSASLRNLYRQSDKTSQRKKLATSQQALWEKYLNQWTNQPQNKLNQQQQQRIYQAMLTAKERNEQRLALNRFVKFGYEYSQAFKVDLPLNPVVIMKLVHPHFGYLNNLPSLAKYKYTHKQLFKLIKQLNAVSFMRDKGYTLHSSELLSFIFWKVLTVGQPRISASEFVEAVKVFKFNRVYEQNWTQELKYSIKEGQILEKEGNLVRFDLLRQIFLDRDL